MDIEVLPPDVNRCGPEFDRGRRQDLLRPVGDQGLRAGGGRGDRRSTRRAGGPFRSLFDFCERLDPGTVNRTAVESLIKAGAFDSLGARRSQMFQVIDRAMQSGAAAAADRRSGQRSLFGGDGRRPRSPPRPGLPDVPEWEPAGEAGQGEGGAGVLPFEPPAGRAPEDALPTYCSHTTVEAAELKHRSEVMLGGMLSAIKFAHTKNPKPGSPSRYAMFDLEDTEGTIRCILWPEQFAQYDDLVQPDAILVVQGSVDKRPGSDEANLIVNELIPLEDLAGRFTRGLRIRLLEEVHGLSGLEQLYEILRGYPGNCELQLLICLGRRDAGLVRLRKAAGQDGRRDAAARRGTAGAGQCPAVAEFGATQRSGSRQWLIPPLGRTSLKPLPRATFSARRAGGQSPVDGIHHFEG